MRQRLTVREPVSGGSWAEPIIGVVTRAADHPGETPSSRLRAATLGSPHRGGRQNVRLRLRPPYGRQMPFLSPITLSGDLVTLEPLSGDHEDGLTAAAADGEIWNQGYTAVPAPGQMGAEIERRLSLQAAGSMLPFTVRRNDSGAVIGMTTFHDMDPVNRHVEIGSTWIARSAQRTGTNTESKLLLLAHAFETLDCIAVEFRTHWLNHQSRTAIARLGARQDGVLRSHRLAKDGTVRDTVVFSIIAGEWPAVRSELRRQLAGHQGVS
jgi:RimJ/RimL family protein N-acetyltransferase